MEKRACDPKFSARVIRFTLVRMLKSLPIPEWTIVARGMGAWMGFSQSIPPPEPTVPKSDVCRTWESDLPEEAPTAIPGRRSRQEREFSPLVSYKPEGRSN